MSSTPAPTSVAPQRSTDALLTVDLLSGAHFGPISFCLSAGEVVVLSGPSGAGKSLILRGIADLDPATGSVFLEGSARERFPASEWRTLVGMLPSESGWWAKRVEDHFSGRDNAWFGLLGLDSDALSWTVARLSSGERQRLALLRLLANGPKVLLLDEPTANLDPDATLAVEGLVKRYVKERSACAIWVSHLREQVERVGDRVIRIMKGGRVESGGVGWTP